jgi:hypothetical protein
MISVSHLFVEGFFEDPLAGPVMRNPKEKPPANYWSMKYKEEKPDKPKPGYEFDYKPIPFTAGAFSFRTERKVPKKQSEWTTL